MESKVNQTQENGIKLIPIFDRILNRPRWVLEQSSTSFSEPSSELPTDLGCKNLSG
jgi:hypothetical protein